MRKEKRKKRKERNESNFPVFSLLLLALFAFFPLSALAAVPFNWAIHGSVFHFAADNGVDSDPAPILPSLGFSASWPWRGLFRLELTQDLYFTNYEYNWERGHAMGSSLENRSAFVMGFITGFQAVGFFPIGNDGMAARIYAGPALDLRIVTLAFGLNHPDDFLGDDRDAQRQTDAIRRYFWGSGRWIFSTAGFGMDFPVNERFLLGFDMRVWFPVYRLWTDRHLPAIDGWRFGAGFRITPRRIEI